MEMLPIILPIVLGDSLSTSPCDLGRSEFVGTGKDGNEQLYSCELGRALWKTTAFTDRSTCESWTECFLDENVNEGEICMGTKCVWQTTPPACYCDKIIDPFSQTDGCDACKFESPSPTHWGQCECISDKAEGFGLADTSGVCECDTYILDGDNCQGGFGSGVFDSGSFLFVKEACLWDPFVQYWRKILCFDEDTIIVEWYSDTLCSAADVSYKVHNDTCYYSSGFMVSADPTTFPTNHPVDSKAPTSFPTAADSPTLSPLIVLDPCDNDYLIETLNDTFHESNDLQWIDDCEDLLLTATEHLAIVCGCIGKFPKKLADQHLNCVLGSHHGLSLWHMCQSSIHVQSCGSKCTDWIAPNDENQSRRRSAVADETFKLKWSLDVCKGYSTNPTTAPDCSDPAGTTPTDYECTCGTAICIPGEHCIEGNNMCYNNAVCHHTDASMIQAFSCTCGTSGALCNINDLGAFLCDETSEQPCVGVSTCRSGTGFELTGEWCNCEHVTSSEMSYCGDAQYCDVKNGWCSQYPTCSDNSGTAATTQQCSCGSPTVVCESEMYCTVSNSVGECSDKM